MQNLKSLACVFTSIFPGGVKFNNGANDSDYAHFRDDLPSSDGRPGPCYDQPMHQI